ncbi:MAG: nuclear transport factor 2 family protein [Balneola sp.]
MKSRVTILFTALILIAGFTINSTLKVQQDEDDIKEVLMTGYVHGAFNELNPEAMTKTFHEDFAIFSPGKEGKINRYPIANWVEGTKRRKADPNFDPANNKWEHTFKRVNVSGKAAHVELELHRNGKHVYTDYLSLLKFDNQWKVVAKVFHEYKTP